MMRFDWRSERSWKTALTAILLVAALLRAGAVHYANGRSARFMWPDSQRYLQAAANVAAGEGPVVNPSDRTGVDPAYPLLLAWAVRASGGDLARAEAAARWLNVVAGLATVIFAAYLGRLLFGPVAGLLAAAMLAVHPIQIYFHCLILTEVLYTALLIGSLYAVARFWAAGAAADLFFAGIGLGLGALLRSSGLLLPILLLPVVGHAGWRRRPAGGRVSSAAASVVTFLVCYISVLLPAAYRNWRLLGAPVPVRTGSGASLLEAVGPWADGGPGMERVVWPGVPPEANEYEKDRIYRAKAIEYIREDPARFLRLAGVKFLRTWNLRMNEQRFRRMPYDMLAIGSSLPVYLLGLIAWWRHRRSVGRWSLLLVPAVYFSLVHMVFVGSVRYRYPAMPALVVLAAAALERPRPGGRAGAGDGSSGAELAGPSG